MVKKCIDRVLILYQYLFLLCRIKSKNLCAFINEGTYHISIPKDLIKELGFREKQKVIVKRRGKGILVEDREK